MNGVSSSKVKLILQFVKNETDLYRVQIRKQVSYNWLVNDIQSVTESTTSMSPLALSTPEGKRYRPVSVMCFFTYTSYKWTYNQSLPKILLFTFCDFSLSYRSHNEIYLPVPLKRLLSLWSRPRIYFLFTRVTYTNPVLLVFAPVSRISSSLTKRV